MQLTIPDLTELLPILAHNFKTKPVNGHLSVNAKNGKGYCWTQTLPCGITMLVTDTCLNECLAIERTETEEPNFVLQFNEELPDEKNDEAKKKRVDDDFDSFVKLSNTMLPETFAFPSTKRLRSVKFLFTKDHLTNLLGQSAAQHIAQFLPSESKNEHPEPIATEYRVMLEDLWTEKVEHPLRLNYIQNRVLLLLEKYVLKLHERNKNMVLNQPRRKADEAWRLVKVEALLVKNFKLPPPTIQKLSRISAMSATKLKNDFKSQYGMPIYAYFQKNRMLKAKSLLVRKQHSITEVGNMIGYSNLSHFANAFRKQFACLPSQIDGSDGTLVYNDK